MIKEENDEFSGRHRFSVIIKNLRKDQCRQKCIKYSINVDGLLPHSKEESFEKFEAEKEVSDNRNNGATSRVDPHLNEKNHFKVKLARMIINNSI